jgi:hypothetical protein
MKLAWKPMSWEYLAAFCDGEGTLQAVNELQASGHIRRRFRITLYQNDPEVLVEIQEFLAKRKISSRFYTVKRKDARHETGHSLEITNAGMVYKVLLKMEPYLRVKAWEAHQIICYLDELIEMASDSEIPMAPRARSVYGAIERM